MYTYKYVCEDKFVASLGITIINPHWLCKSPSVGCKPNYCTRKPKNTHPTKTWKPKISSKTSVQAQKPKKNVFFFWKHRPWKMNGWNPEHIAWNWKGIRNTIFQPNLQWCWRPFWFAGQTIVFHPPRFHWNKGISLTKPPFRVRSLEVAIVWPEFSSVYRCLFGSIPCFSGLFTLFSSAPGRSLDLDLKKKRRKPTKKTAPLKWWVFWPIWKCHQKIHSGRLTLRTSWGVLLVSGRVSKKRDVSTNTVKDYMVVWTDLKNISQIGSINWNHHPNLIV